MSWPGVNGQLPWPNTFANYQLLFHVNVPAYNGHLLNMYSGILDFIPAKADSACFELVLCTLRST